MQIIYQVQCINVILIIFINSKIHLKSRLCANLLWPQLLWHSFAQIPKKIRRVSMSSWILSHSSTLHLDPLELNPPHLLPRRRDIDTCFHLLCTENLVQYRKQMILLAANCTLQTRSTSWCKRRFVAGGSKPENYARFDNLNFDRGSRW